MHWWVTKLIDVCPCFNSDTEGLNVHASPCDQPCTMAALKQLFVQGEKPSQRALAEALFTAGRYTRKQLITVIAEVCLVERYRATKIYQNAMEALRRKGYVIESVSFDGEELMRAVDPEDACSPATSDNA